MKKIYFYILFLIIPSALSAQTVSDTLITGKVTSQSAENIFVSFESTKGIEKDDTLFIKKTGKLKPALKVKFVSSKSLAGESISKYKIKIGNELIAKIRIVPRKKEMPVESAVVTASDSEENITPVVNYNEPKTIEPKVRGRIGIQSYSNFSNSVNSFDYQRWRYAFRLDAQNIGGSNFSYSQYINFSYRANEWNEISNNLGRALRIYDLAVKYDFSDKTNIWFGRHLNRNITNISAIDGLQFETSFSALSVGLVAGSRPNFNDMGFNAKLFEYGVYLSRFDSIGQRGMTNTLGYFEQTNDFKTDRRFLYFQHSNSAIKNVRLFLSTEIDLFKKINGENKSDFSATSFYVSANIRPSRIVSFFLSYDARKNVIYYETFKNTIDSILENETRQGFRARVNLRPVRNLYLGVNYGYRFRRGDFRPSNNYGGFLTYSSLPVIRAGMTVSFNRLYSGYLDGTIWGLRLYKDFLSGFGISLGYRKTKYSFTQNISDLTQQSVSFNINTRIFNPVFVNFTYEGVFQSVRTSGRLLINLSYRF